MARPIEASLYAGLILMVAVLFLPGTQGEFFETWDDGPSVTSVPEIRQISPQNVVSMFTSFHGNLYKPLVLLSHALENSLFGMNAVAFRVTNLFFHALNTLLVLFFLRRLGLPLNMAFLGALLFGVHPAKVETVCWASQRKDLMFTAFYLAGLLAYGKRRAAPFLFFIGACLSKAVAITFPAALLLMDYHDDGRITRRKLFDKVPYALISVLFVFIAVKAGAVNQVEAGKWWLNAMFTGVALSHYLEIWFFPFKLSPFHPHPWVFRASMIFTAITPVLLVILIFLARKMDKRIWIGTLFFLVTIGPTIQLIPSVGQSLVVDHYLYLPSVGLAYATVSLLILCGLHKRRWITLAIAVVWIGLLAFVAHQYIPAWKNDFSIWTEVLKKYPMNQTAYFNRGNAHMQAARYSEAIRDFETAAKITPKDNDVQLNLAASWRALGDSSKAEQIYLKLLQTDPSVALAHNNLGEIYLANGNSVKADDEFSKAVAVNPRLWQAFANKGSMRFQQENYAEAAFFLEQAARMRPAAAGVYILLGRAYGALGRFPEAEQQFLESLQWDPLSEEARALLSMTRENNAHGI